MYRPPVQQPRIMMSRRTFTTASALVSVAFMLPACGGADDPKLAAKQSALDRLAADFIKRNGVPGISVALLSTQGGIVSARGLRVLARSDKVLPTDAFHIGSNAKSMLAMMIMRSVELGQLKLETPIYDLVPRLRDSGKAAYAQLTLEQLLSHRAGIEPLLVTQDIDETLPMFEGSAMSQRQQALTFLTSRDPVVTPGASFAYSNGGYAVAAAVLEAVTQKSYEQLIEERVFSPLGIKASISWPAQAVAAAPYGHLYIDSAFTPLEPDAPIAKFRAALSPAGNVSMNILDYTKYLRAQLLALRGEAGLALSMGSYQRMHKAVGGADSTYALGWGTDGKDKKSQQANYHYGSTDIFGCFAIVQAAKNRAVAVMVNGEVPPFDEAITGLSYAILSLLD